MFRVRFTPMSLDFSGGNFSKFLDLHWWHALSGDWVSRVKPGEGELGTGLGLTLVPLSGPKERSAKGLRSRRWTPQAKCWITYTSNFTLPFIWYNYQKKNHLKIFTLTHKFQFKYKDSSCDNTDSISRLFVPGCFGTKHKAW